MKEKLICKPFNGVYLMVFAVFALLFAVGVVVLRKKDEEVRAKVLAAAMLVTLVGIVIEVKPVQPEKVEEAILSPDVTVTA